MHPTHGTQGSHSRLRLHPLWLALGWCLVALVVYFSLTPRPPEVALRVWDKASHLLAYGALMLWFAQIYATRKHRFALALGFVAMGVALEYLQGLSGARRADALDALANTLGVALGCALAATPLGRILRRLEAEALARGAAR